MVDTVVIIGAGAGGIGAALSLADKGYHVKLIEKHTLGSGSSGRNPGRMGHGFHYTDIETAIAYLHASIKVQKKYPGFLLHDHIPDSPLRKGRYFITKNSNPGKEAILACYEKLKEEYARLVAADPANAVFGPPDKFYRILDRSEYENDVNMDVVEMGIETNEHIFRWNDFASHIKKVIEAHPNIELIENTGVEKISRNLEGRDRFSLELSKKDKPNETLKTNYIVNSTWENIELLNANIGIGMPEEERTNRLKALLIAKLPEELTEKNSMFFCMGPHGMMSNMGNGIGMMTYAKVTNIEASSGVTLSSNAQRLLQGGATPEEIQLFGEQILTGISEFIPAMKHAKIQTVKFGVVQTLGELSLNQLPDPNHQFNKRSDHCVRPEQIGIISNPCVKMFYFIDNGEIVLDLFELQVKATLIIDNVIQDIMINTALAKVDFNGEKERGIREQMERCPINDLLTTPKEVLVKKYMQQLLPTSVSVVPLSIFKPYTTSHTTSPNPTSKL